MIMFCINLALTTLLTYLFFAKVLDGFQIRYETNKKLVSILPLEVIFENKIMKDMLLKDDANNRNKNRRRRNRKRKAKRKSRKQRFRKKSSGYQKAVNS